jgi:hypothetical protein
MMWGLDPFAAYSEAVRMNAVYVTESGDYRPHLSEGESAMPLTFEAIYENGVLKPVEPLPLKENERVLVRIQTGDTPLLRAYGIMGWTGSVELADFIAMDPELDFPPPPEEP